MANTGTPTSRPDHSGPAGSAFEVVTAVSMTLGRGPAARAIAELAELTAGDVVVDVGCGPGTAARVAARRCDWVTAVDPSAAMLRLGRWLTAIRRLRNVTFRSGAAEALPVADATATVVWALSSVHHWTDRSAGLAEAARVLVAGGRILLAERLVPPGATGHAAHGLTAGGAEQLAADLAAAGFVDIRTEHRQAGRRSLVIVRGSRPEVR